MLTDLVLAVRKNKVRLIVFGVFAALTLVAALLPQTADSLPLLLTGTAVCAVVCVIGLIITCAVGFYRSVRNGISADRAQCALITRLLSCFLLCALILTVTIGCIAAAMVGLSHLPSVSEEETAEQIETIYGADVAALYREQTQAINGFMTTAAQRGYTSLSFYVCLYVQYLVTLLLFHITLFSALCFAKLWKNHPLFSSLCGYIILDLISDFLSSFLSYLSTLAAPGLGAVSGRFAAFLPTNADNITALLSQMGAALPEATDFIKLSAFSSLCSVVVGATCILIGVAILKHEPAPKQV